MAKLALAAALALAAGFLYSQRDWRRYRRLHNEGAGVDGWVTGKSAGKEQLVHYGFRGPQKIHTGVGEAGYGNKEFDALEPGDSVIVFYLPSDPDFSCLGDPERRLSAQHSALVYLLLGGIPLIAFALKRELGRFPA